MASRYSVIQYVPDPIADERINIGVLAFDNNAVKIHFVKNWERVRHFGMEEIGFLKDFAHRMENGAKEGLLFPGDKLNGVSNQERLLKIAQGWMNSIQFTEPRGSLNTVDKLLQDIANTYLREPQLESNLKFKPRDRKAAAKIVRSKTREVLIQEFGDVAKELLRNDYELPGKHKNNKFDIVVANGKPYFAAHGISFEVDVPDRLTDAVFWRILDVKSNHPNFPLAIVVLPPKVEQHNYHEIENAYRKNIATYEEVGADILQENAVERWVSKQIVDVNITLPIHV
ncbi:DUF3037 domain-containing protein [Anabaena catenula]|uniref:DUF3037 domain-containing protein n=1 Tax=Anabaena catenula FACHB-362 TaxID=2692877 RepID=A0ABR8J2R5_9NOST|nr:DUF3037 domain-containing protein [Anabaena catenula]MBD2691948.1 DUF3037 domain-containing protein [Anabaena catenula FACHB-362]